MEFEPTEFVRKSFTVKAVEVSYDNIEAVADWCRGKVDTETTKVLGGNEIKLPVIKFAGQGEDKGKELIARLGYFIVHSKGRFRVYKAPQFHAAFEEKVVWQSNDHESDCDKQHQGDTTEQIAEKLGFKPADYCVDHNTKLSECGELHMTNQVDA